MRVDIKFGLFFLFALLQATAIGKAMNNPTKTLVWKISKAGMKNASYLLGINHIVSASWLYEFNEIANIIGSSELLLTELYGDNQQAINGDGRNVHPTYKPKIKTTALSLLSPAQFSTLDSFFVSRVGEGITNNKVAMEMSVWEMCSAITVTLINTRTAEGIALPSMDRELYQSFKNRNIPCLALDHIDNFDFKEKEAEKAKKILSIFVDATRVASLANFDLSDTSNAIGKGVADYKSMNIEYKLNQPDPETLASIGRLTIRERNESWIPLVKSSIGQRRCLIAVGASHLFYKTGLISLLRAEGYKVEPVSVKQ